MARLPTLTAPLVGPGASPLAGATTWAPTPTCVPAGHDVCLLLVNYECRSRSLQPWASAASCGQLHSMLRAGSGNALDALWSAGLTAANGWRALPLAWRHASKQPRSGQPIHTSYGAWRRQRFDEPLEPHQQRVDCGPRPRVCRPQPHLSLVQITLQSLVAWRPACSARCTGGTHAVCMRS